VASVSSIPGGISIKQWQQQVEQQLIQVETQLKMTKVKADTLREHSNMLEGSLNTLRQLEPTLKQYAARE
jgi:hypothetical protein